VITRRTFLGLAVGTVAYAATQVMCAGPTESLNDRLEHVCFSLGRWSREQNVQIQRVIMTDESGHLVIDGKSGSGATRYNFHLADRTAENYTKIDYRVEPRYLMRALELSVIIHTENGCHRFPLVFKGLRLENLS